MAKTNADIEHWDVENDEFWEKEGKRIASRNLWISIPSLLMGFAVWLMWGMITTQMKNLGFDFTIEQLFTLSAIAGLSGATLRIPASFMIKIAGGRNTIFLTTALLMIPAAGTGIALMNPDTPFIIFQALALLSGIGGGNFACSMSNISSFYPKSKQGYGLGMNAGQQCQCRSEEHTSELQSRPHLVCRLLLEKKNGLTPHSSQIMRIQLPLVYLVCDTVFFLSLDAVSPYCRQPARARLTIRAFLFPAHVGGHP